LKEKRKPAAAISKQAKQLRELIGRGKEQGYLTSSTLNRSKTS